LSCGGRGSPQDGDDLVEGHVEHVVQHEGEPLGGSQRFEYHQQRGTDRIRHYRFVFGVDPGRSVHDGRGDLRAQGLLAP